MPEAKKEHWEDHIVAEVRAVRDAYAKKFNYDIDAICDDLHKSEEDYKKMGFKFVTLPPKKIPKATGTDS